MSVIGAEIQETEIFASLPWRSQDAREFSYYKGRWMRPKFETYDSQEQIELCLNCPFSDECMDCVSKRSKRTSLIDAMLSTINPKRRKKEG